MWLNPLENAFAYTAGSAWPPLFRCHKQHASPRKVSLRAHRVSHMSRIIARWKGEAVSALLSAPKFWLFEHMTAAPTAGRYLPEFFEYPKLVGNAPRCLAARTVGKGATP